MFVDVGEETQGAGGSDGAAAASPAVNAPAPQMSREAARRRLSNLGYASRLTLEENIKDFQRDLGDRQPSGRLADIADRLRQHHDVLIAPPKSKQSS